MGPGGRGVWLRVGVVGSMLVALGVALAIFITIKESPSRGRTLLDVLHVFISWPVVAFGLGLIFRKDIAAFIQFMSLRFPGLPGRPEISSKQLPPPDDDTGGGEPGPGGAPGPPAADTESITLNAEQLAVIRSHMDGLRKKAENAKQEKENIFEAAVNLLNEKQKEVVGWWFNYLSLFLVPKTKFILSWFGSQTVAPTKEYFHETWKQIVPDTKERETILMVLLHHGLIEAKNQVLQITQAGRDFLNFIGPLLPPEK